eukprot:1161688-Pelagomonas_calceolata.AAC.9
MGYEEGGRVELLDRLLSGGQGPRLDRWLTTCQEALLVPELTGGSFSTLAGVQLRLIPFYMKHCVFPIMIIAMSIAGMN